MPSLQRGVGAQPLAGVGAKPPQDGDLRRSIQKSSRIVVRSYIYPTLSSPPPSLHFANQFAFRPSGSTTAAIIAVLNTVTDLLSSEPYVIVVSLDCSKAFDTAFAIHHCFRNSHSSIFLTTSTTGWPTSSTTIRTAPYSVINNHPCLTSLPVSYRDPLSDQPPMSSHLGIWQSLPLATLYVNLPMAPT